jgi:hypothetical protein
VVWLFPLRIRKWQFIHFDNGRYFPHQSNTINFSRILVHFVIFQCTNAQTHIMLNDVKCDRRAKFLFSYSLHTAQLLLLIHFNDHYPPNLYQGFTASNCISSYNFHRYLFIDSVVYTSALNYSFTEIYTLTTIKICFRQFTATWHLALKFLVCSRTPLVSNTGAFEIKIRHVRVDTVSRDELSTAQHS